MLMNIAPLPTFKRAVISIRNCVFVISAITYSATANTGLATDVQCSPYCKRGVCDPSLKYCMHGCQPGYRLPTCTQYCHTGSYGPGCESTCSNRCIGGICNAINGECTHGCKGNYQPPYCEKCMRNYYGTSCDSLCDRKCVDQSCDSVTGQCHQCLPGHTGPHCREQSGSDMKTSQLLQDPQLSATKYATSNNSPVYFAMTLMGLTFAAAVVFLLVDRNRERRAQLLRAAHYVPGEAAHNVKQDHCSYDDDDYGTQDTDVTYEAETPGTEHEENETETAQGDETTTVQADDTTQQEGQAEVDKSSTEALTDSCDDYTNQLSSSENSVFDVPSDVQEKI